MTAIENRPLTGELADAIKLADRILERPNGDPDDDLAVLSRQLLRSQEKITVLLKMVDIANRRAASDANVTHPELEEAIKHVTAYDDCQMGMLEWTKVYRLIVAARHYVWMLKRTEELNALNAKLTSIVVDDKEGDLDFIKFQFRDAINKAEGRVAAEEQVRSERSERANTSPALQAEVERLREAASGMLAALEEGAEAMERASAAICAYDDHDPSVGAACNLAYRNFCKAIAAARAVGIGEV